MAGRTLNCRTSARMRARMLDRVMGSNDRGTVCAVYKGMGRKPMDARSNTRRRYTRGGCDRHRHTHSADSCSTHLPILPANGCEEGVGQGVQGSYPVLWEEGQHLPEKVQAVGRGGRVPDRVRSGTVSHSKRGGYYCGYHVVSIRTMKSCSRETRDTGSKVATMSWAYTQYLVPCSMKNET